MLQFTLFSQADSICCGVGTTYLDGVTISQRHRLQNSRFLPFSEGAKRRKRNPRPFSLAVSTLALDLSFEYYFTVSLAFAKNTTVLQSINDIEAIKAFTDFVSMLTFGLKCNDPAANMI